MRVMVIGASNDRAKYGNKAVRAYARQGHEVLPVNPGLDTVEDLPCYHAVADVPGPIDRATLYIPPAAAPPVVRALAARTDVGEVWLNPGADAPEVVDLCRSVGITPVLACAILDIGESPSRF